MEPRDLELERLPHEPLGPHGAGDGGSGLDRKLTHLRFFFFCNHQRRFFKKSQRWKKWAQDRSYRGQVGGGLELRRKRKARKAPWGGAGQVPPELPNPPALSGE